ncbi:MAG: GNAT family N-acetyltransferase [Christensenellales bacterium]
MNEKIILERPGPQHMDDVFSYMQEHIGQGEYHLHGSGGLDKALSYEEWLEDLRHEQTQPKEGLVPATTFFAVRKHDRKLIGAIQIRHELNDFLLKYYGHIGFGVRPMERKKGYATQMLGLALDYCRQLGLENILISCDKTNAASAATIQKCGGVLENEVAQEDGSLLQRYWISL